MSGGLNISKVVNANRFVICRMMSGREAGSIREAGGAFAEMEKARENQYFNQLQEQQLEIVRKHLHQEIAHHKESIQQHQSAIDRHKMRVKEVESIFRREK